jgi:receptor protein-tyrosine kinase
VIEQRASIPESPVTPKKMRNIATGLVIGLALGVGFALLRELLDNTVKDRETLEQITGVGVVGSVPLDKDRRDTPAISFDTDKSLIAEAFRKIRTNLTFLNVDSPPRVIVVTSSAPSEGKTTTAINIALALAEGEHNVVLVDGDMRRPSLAKYLDLVSSVGFSTVLSGAAPLADVLQQTKYPGLSVLAAGPNPPNPSELLGSQTAGKVLEELRSEFDYVIIDSSPLLAVTDGAILASHADGTLMIVKFGQTKRDQLAHSTGTLSDVGAVLLGAVVTMTPTRGNSTYSYYYSYYGESGKQSSAGPSPSS